MTMMLMNTLWQRLMQGQGTRDPENSHPRTYFHHNSNEAKVQNDITETSREEMLWRKPSDTT